jgi:hypothetical protein
LAVRSKPPNDPRPPLHADALQEAGYGTKIPAKTSPTAITGKSAQGLPKADVQAAARKMMSHLSPQLLDYLISPSKTDYYTGVQDITSQAAVSVRHKNMKEFLEGWKEGWENMSVARDK